VASAFMFRHVILHFTFPCFDYRRGSAILSYKRYDSEQKK
jgi:hypothetical protein